MTKSIVTILDHPDNDGGISSVKLLDKEIVVSLRLHFDIQFINEGLKSVTVQDSRILASSEIVGTVIRQTDNPNPNNILFIVNVTKVETGMLTALISAQEKIGDVIHEARYTGTVSLGFTIDIV